MTARKAITAKMKINALLYRAFTQDCSIRCVICGKGLYPAPDCKIDFDHGVPLALGGAHHFVNLRPVHRECHRIKTSGSKATTAGSDIHKIAKAKRIANGGKKRKGRKIQSAPFPKVHRPMRGR